MNFTKDERIKIWGDIKSLCSEDMQNECEDKLQKLFAHGNHDVYLKRLHQIYFTFTIFMNNSNENFIVNMDSEKALFAMLDAYEEYEYFNKHVKINKKDYDYTKIRKKFEDIEPLLISDSKIVLRVPIHPNYVYNDTLHTLIEDCNFDDEKAEALLNTFSGVNKKPPQTKQAKREFRQIFDVLNKILNDAEEKGHDKEDIERERTELKKILQY